METHAKQRVVKFKGTKQQLHNTCSVIVEHRSDIEMELKGGQIELAFFVAILWKLFSLSPNSHMQIVAAYNAATACDATEGYSMH